MSSGDTENADPALGSDAANAGSSDRASARRVERPKSKGLLSFRNVAIVSVLVVGGAVGYELWRSPDLTGPSRVRGTPNVDTTPAGDQLRTSERYQDNLRRQNEQGADEAAQTGDSFIATPDEPLRDIDAPPPAADPNPHRPLPPPNPVAEPSPPRTVVIERSQPQSPAPQAADTQQADPDYSRIDRLAQLMAAQQQGLLQS